MEPTVCEHIETIHKVPGSDLQVAECPLCGQLREFGGSGEPVITKLGRIDDKIVMPKAGQRLEITPEESRLVREGWDMIREVQEEKEFRNKLKAMTKAPSLPPVPWPEPEPEPVEAEVEPTPETSLLVETVKTLDQMNTTEKSQYWESHQEEILKDLPVIGSKAMREKWGMSSPGWVGVKKRWKSQGVAIPTPLYIRPGPQKGRS